MSLLIMYEQYLAVDRFLVTSLSCFRLGLFLPIRIIFALQADDIAFHVVDNLWRDSFDKLRVSAGRMLDT